MIINNKDIKSYVKWYKHQGKNEFYATYVFYMKASDYNYCYIGSFLYNRGHIRFNTFLTVIEKGKTSHKIELHVLLDPYALFI